MKKAMVLSMALLSALFIASCATAENNGRDLHELADHFAKCGLPVSEVGVLNPDPAHAESGLTVKIAGRQIGIYKFDLNKKKQREHLEKAVKRGFLGVAGVKFEKDDFAVNGSFAMIDFKANEKAAEILKAFESF